MIRAWLLILIVLAAGAAGAWALRGDAGYVLLNHGPWVLETSLLGLFLSMALALFALVYGLRLLAAVIRLPTTLRNVFDRRRRDKARDSFEAGLRRLMEGNWKRAEIDLVRRASDHRSAQLNYLGAARAAQKLGAADRRDHYLQLAAQAEPSHDLAVLITQAELQLERGEFAQARETALLLRERDAKSGYAVELLAQAFLGLQDWEALRGLLVETDKIEAMPAERREALLRQAMLALIERIEADGKLDQLKSLWDAAGGAQRRDPVLRRRYARALHRLNADAEAASLIGEALKADWDGELVRLYGELLGSDGLSRLAAIEQWLGEYGEREELLVTAGRACLQNKLWGKARSYLEAAARLKPTPAAYRELARLCEQTQNPEEAARYYRLGLELATP